jgi:hypothetical protein
MDNMRTVNNDIHSFVTGVEQINTKAVEIADSCNKQVAFYKVRECAHIHTRGVVEFFKLINNILSFWIWSKEPLGARQVRSGI